MSSRLPTKYTAKWLPEYTATWLRELANEADHQRQQPKPYGPKEPRRLTVATVLAQIEEESVRRAAHGCRDMRWPLPGLEPDVFTSTTEDPDAEELAASVARHLGARGFVVVLTPSTVYDYDGSRSAESDSLVAVGTGWSLEMSW